MQKHNAVTGQITDSQLPLFQCLLQKLRMFMERWIENHTRSSRVFPSGAQGTHGGCSGPCKTKWVKRILGSHFKNHHRHKANIFTPYTTLVKRQVPMNDTILTSTLCPILGSHFLHAMRQIFSPHISPGKTAGEGHHTYNLQSHLLSDTARSIPDTV